MNGLKWLKFNSFLIFLVLIIHFRLIAEDPILNRDDQLILDHLKNWDFYLEKFKHGEFLAPWIYSALRDLTLWFDGYLGDLTSLSTYHLTNTLIFVAVLFEVRWLFYSVLGSTSWIVQTAVFGFAVHPVANIPAIWLSGRKHLIAFYFFLLATRYVRSGQKKWKPLVAYLASLLSHPIFILFPVWWLFYEYLNLKGKKLTRASRLRPLTWAGGSILFGIVLAVYTLRHYKTDYVWFFSTLKILPQNTNDFGQFNNLGISVLSLGRYLFNFVFPYRIFVTYYPGAWPNLIGVAILGVLISLLLLKKNKPILFEWTLWSSLPLILFVVFPTNIFVSDCYALAPLLGALLGATVLIQKINIKMRWLVVLVLGTWIASSVDQSEVWMTDESLWQRAVQLEPSPTAITALATKRFIAGQIHLVKPLLARLLIWDPEHPYTKQLFMRTVYRDDSLSTDQKITIFNNNQIDSAWHSYYLAHLLAEKRLYSKALGLLECALKNPDELRDDAQTVLSEMTAICLKVHKQKDCASVGMPLRR